jgi:hypothetical protein
LQPATSSAQNETPITTNADSFQPFEGPALFIIIACISVSLLAGILFFRKKTKDFMKLKDKEN